ncbi:unnamed protein product [Chondrus crispus]|uniref:Uncharacterized protein n=1 Tax=Chondrus crispus TaxID=2769 RepID=R7Q713_CHOCR|nr:unnamed protein product [Chondrus crispus]CDF33260.1 unnamed protein product [Chondrus crispus]|eukprot:XP_005713063.1 unnamed protein product [Chondrus crispus]
MGEGRLNGIACKSVESGGGLGNSSGSLKVEPESAAAGFVASIVAVEAGGDVETVGGSCCAFMAKRAAGCGRIGDSGTIKVVRVTSGPDVGTRKADMARASVAFSAMKSLKHSRTRNWLLGG